MVNQVQDAILDGRLKNGDVLPSERDLKEMFNTSRGTLREALRVLEERGLIEIRLGVRGGSIVKPLTTRHVSQTLALLIRSQMVSLKQLCEFREGVEGLVASLAAQRADNSDKKRLYALLQKSGKLVEQENVDRDAFIESDRKIHLELANISRNSIYIFVLHSVHENIHQYFHNFLSMEKPEFIDNYKDLCNLVEAVDKGFADKARVLAQNHVIKFYRNMKKREELVRVNRTVQY